MVEITPFSERDTLKYGMKNIKLTKSVIELSKATYKKYTKSIKTFQSFLQKICDKKLRQKMTVKKLAAKKT